MEELEIINFGHPSYDIEPLRPVLSFRDRTPSALTARPSSSSIEKSRLHKLIIYCRKTIPIEEQSEIWAEVQNQLQQLQMSKKKLSRKRTFTAPKTQLG
jgi:hypothetical protein